MKRQKENCFRKAICRLLRQRLLSSALKENQIFYINGAQTLPVPLSPDEEKELLDALPQHPENRQILIEKNLKVRGSESKILFQSVLWDLLRPSILLKRIKILNWQHMPHAVLKMKY